MCIFVQSPDYLARLCHRTVYELYDFLGIKLEHYLFYFSIKMTVILHSRQNWRPQLLPILTKTLHYLVFMLCVCFKMQPAILGSFS